jgi:hypothetical protein
VDTTGRNPWIVLGLPESASYDMARRAFRRKASQTHPDHGGDHRSYLAVQAAWDALRPRLVAEPARRPNPFAGLTAPTLNPRDLLESPRRSPVVPVRQPNRRIQPDRGSVSFASVLEGELSRLAAA